ncbi:polysaccharide deacetylase family protein [Actinomadura oligospora]|uniref:polysaccharide deacetylase family protein n=1 Tax=Actinomadura oligospora TaxID=111804 RepID=UPI0004AD37AD|nr:polysaccharide deacetylase family protein [Actinomadura oligospora]
MTADQPDNRPTDRPADRPNDQTNDRSADPQADRPDDRPNDQADDQRAVAILMYHSVTDRPTPETRGLSVPVAAFADQMAHLAAEGFTPLPFSALGSAAHSRARRPVVITFDDGYADFHENALPILERHGFAATVFVTTGWLADAGADAAGRPLDRMLSWAQAAEAAAHGIEIGGHSHSHPQLDQLDDHALREELVRSRDLLEERLGAPVRTMAYPFGYSSARVRRMVRAVGYDTACAVANRMAAGAADPLAVPRLTVRATTRPRTFARVVEGRDIPLIFLKDHALTRAYAVVRRTRYALRRATAPHHALTSPRPSDPHRVPAPRRGNTPHPDEAPASESRETRP